MRWLSQREVVAIPTSARSERIWENFDLFDIKLSPDGMAAIATLDLKEGSLVDHRDPAVVTRLVRREGRLGRCYRTSHCRA